MRKWLALVIPILFSPMSWAAGNGNELIVTPEKLLPAGVDDTIATNPYTGESGKVRKGTVAASINNVATLNKLLQQNPSPENDKKIQEVAQAVDELLPSLKIIGMFDFFNINEWLSDPVSQPGRTLIGLHYLAKYPQENTPEIKKLLEELNSEIKNVYLRSALATVKNARQNHGSHSK